MLHQGERCGFKQSACPLELLPIPKTFFFLKLARPTHKANARSSRTAPHPINEPTQQPALFQHVGSAGGVARLGTMSTVTTWDEYPQPFVVLVVMVLILMCFFHIKCGFSQVDCISCFQMPLIMECFDNVQT